MDKLPYTYTIEKKIYTASGLVEFWQVRSDGITRRVDENHWSVPAYKGKVETSYIDPPVDTRTNEEKREAEYSAELDPIIKKIVAYEIEMRYTDDPARKVQIEDEILKPLAADLIKKKKAIREKYVSALWKPKVLV